MNKKYTTKTMGFALIVIASILSMTLLVGCALFADKLHDNVAPSSMDLDYGNDYITVTHYYYSDNFNRYVEYSVGNDEWQDDNEFVNLIAGTTYNVSVRTKGDDYYKPSEAYTETVKLPKYDTQIDAQSVSLSYIDYTVFVDSDWRDLEIMYDNDDIWTNDRQYTYDDRGVKEIFIRHKDTPTSNASETVKFNIKVSGFYTGSGTEESPYLIKTTQHLLAINNGEVGVWYKLENDLSLDGIVIDNAIKTSTATSSNITRGGFDGNNKTISNVVVIAKDAGEVALFSCFHTVKDLTVDNISIAAEYERADTIFPPDVSSAGANRLAVGGVVGYAVNVSNVNASGQININSTGNTQAKCVGGIAGMASRINNSHSEVEITTVAHSNSSAYIVGGVVGRLKSDTLIKSTYNQTINIDSEASIYVGGIVGHIDTTLATARVEDSYSLGQIVAHVQEQAKRVGGIVGLFNGNLFSGNNSQLTIRNTYSSMDIIVEHTTASTATIDPTMGNYIGGIMGQNKITESLGKASTVQIQNSFFNGTLDVRTNAQYFVYVGSIIAPIEGTLNPSLHESNTLDNCYYTQSSSGNFSGNIGFLSLIHDKCDIASDEQLLSANWQTNILKFDPSIWDISDGRLPILK